MVKNEPPTLILRESVVFLLLNFVYHSERWMRCGGEKGKESLLRVCSPLFSFLIIFLMRKSAACFQLWLSGRGQSYKYVWKTAQKRTIAVLHRIQMFSVCTVLLNSIICTLLLYALTPFTLLALHIFTSCSCNLVFYFFLTWHLFKGTVARDFLPLFFMNWPHMGPWFTL